MKVKLDENLPISATDLFEKLGIGAETVLSEGLGGAGDDSVAHVSHSEDRVLVTLDTDFADIRTYPPADYPGFIVLRPALQDIDSILNLLQRVVPRIEEEFTVGSLWIVEEGRIRIRE